MQSSQKFTEFLTGSLKLVKRHIRQIKQRRISIPNVPDLPQIQRILQHLRTASQQRGKKKTDLRQPTEKRRNHFGTL